MNKMFFYGSLKKGYWNHGLVSMSKENKFVKNYTIQGFTLWDIGYPIAVREKGSHINGEIWLVSDLSYNYIKGMEFGASYNEEVIDGFIIYTQPKNNIKLYSNINHIGSDWPKQE